MIFFLLRRYFRHSDSTLNLHRRHHLQQRQHEISWQHAEYLLKNLQADYEACNTTQILSRFSTPCVCYFTSPDQTFGAVHNTPGEIAHFFRRLRKVLFCERMRFVVATKSRGAYHEYEWESDIGAGTAIVGWEYSRTEESGSDWQITYLDIQCTDLKRV
eukprot:TRINITY_DN10596_c0_g1_i3.p1 TRINITY_DN10596_c0_g1~~TRINITY_DN10596_c0_g1_i3.p1  ORF type:complete len:159 (-),score=13.06 TRINITY_DN10596_c0_g1_i3:64-540(-)